MNNDPNTEDDNTADIRRPGAVGPAPHARPITVGHHPEVSDTTNRPMHHESLPPDQLNKAPDSAEPLPPLPIVRPGEISRPLVAMNNEPRLPDNHVHHFPTGSASPDSLSRSPEVGAQLPTDHPHHHNHKPLWGLVFVVLVLIGLYLLLDSQIIKNNLSLPVHVFKQDSPPVYTP